MADAQKATSSVTAAPPTAESSQFERFVSDLSNAFATIPVDATDAAITHWLRRLVEFLEIDGASVSQLADGRPLGQITHNWLVPGWPPLPATFGDKDVPWVVGRLSRGEVTSFATPDELPCEAATDRASYERIHVVSLLDVPLLVNGVSIGSLALGTFLKPRQWSDEIVHRVRLIGQIMGNALVRKRNQEDLQRRLQFELLLSDLLSRLVSAHIDQVGMAIELSLRQIVEFLGIDRAVLYELSEDGTVLNAKYSYAVNQVEPVVQYDASAQVPWLVSQARQGQIQGFVSLDELPDDAETDRRTLAAAGVKSGLVIPLRTQGRLHHVLTLATVRESHAWSEGLLPRLQMVGTVVVSALVQQETHAEVHRLKEQLESENMYLRSEIRTIGGYEEVVGQSTVIAEALAQAEQVAHTDSTVLILGETGTGKELLAHVIHSRSARRIKPFVTVNLAALPSSLLESELFGRERGAYTGALTKQTGRFEVADGGTVFLDEIGEMPPETQAKLLRVLECGEFERLGSPRKITVDVRIIAATNRELERAVRSGHFREDLYYRLNVFPIRVPPLKERREDIPLLVWAFIKEFGEKMGKRIENVRRRDMDALQEYSWPGNVRELRNVIERSMIVSRGSSLQLVLPESLALAELPLDLAEAEKRHIVEVLARTHWRVRGDAGAAELLGLKPSTLESKMKKLGISRPK
jgi:transcriptional regulator with GAF, ATPase, and Fis domain